MPASRFGLELKIRVAGVKRKGNVSLISFQRNVASQLGKQLKRLQMNIAERTPAATATGKGDGVLAQAMRSDAARRIEIDKDRIRGYIVFPSHVKHYGPIQNWGTRYGSSNSLAVKAIPSVADIQVWLYNRFGYDPGSTSTRKIAASIVRNIATWGIPSNTEFDNREFIQKSMREMSQSFRFNLEKWVKAGVRNAQFFPLTVKG